MSSRPACRASWPRWVPMPGISQTPSGQKVATTSSVRPSSRAWVYAAMVARTPSATSAYVTSSSRQPLRPGRRSGPRSPSALRGRCRRRGCSRGFTLTACSAGSSFSYGRPARKPSMVRSKFEMPPSARSDRRMYSNPLACRPRCCLGRFEKSWAGIGGQRGSSHSHGSGGVGLVRLVALGEPGEGPDLHQRLLRSQWAEAVGGGAAVHGQHEVVREAVAHRLVEPSRLEIVEVGDVRARRPVPVARRRR